MEIVSMFSFSQKQIRITLEIDLSLFFEEKSIDQRIRRFIAESSETILKRSILFSTIRKSEVLLDEQTKINRTASMNLKKDQFEFHRSRILI